MLDISFYEHRELMKAIIGLGNPGDKYKFTRHNVGFLIIDEIARKKKVKLQKKKFLSYFGQIKVGGERVYLIKPLTYMNLSGEAVLRIKKYLRLKSEDLLVMLDDANLSTGIIRFREKGVAAGHNGLASIIEELHTTVFPRLRVGIGRPCLGESLEHYVLKLMRKKETASILSVVSQASDAALFWVNSGTSKAMNKFNIRQPENKN